MPATIAGSPARAAWWAGSASSSTSAAGAGPSARARPRSPPHWPRQRVEARAAGEVVGVLRAAVQHHHQRRRPARVVAGGDEEPCSGACPRGRCTCATRRCRRARRRAERTDAPCRPGPRRGRAWCWSWSMLLRVAPAFGSSVLGDREQVTRDSQPGPADAEGERRRRPRLERPLAIPCPYPLSPAVQKPKKSTISWLRRGRRGRCSCRRCCRRASGGPSR